MKKRTGMTWAAERNIGLTSHRDFGARVLDAIPVPWTFARVDVVDTRPGPVLMELELIEPDLFFTCGSDGARRLAEALYRQCAVPDPQGMGRTP